MSLVIWSHIVVICPKDGEIMNIIGPKCEQFALFRLWAA